MNFNDDKDDFFDGPDIQEVPKTPKAPLLKPEDPDYWEQDEPEFEHLLPPRRNTTIWLCVAAAVLAVAAFIAVYLWFFSPFVTEAVQYGYVEDIEKRGEVFKTYEGTILPYKELMDTTRVYRKDLSSPSRILLLRWNCAVCNTPTFLHVSNMRNITARCHGVEKAA